MQWYLAISRLAGLSLLNLSWASLLWLLTVCMHLMKPMARLIDRIRHSGLARSRVLTGITACSRPSAE